METHTKTHKTHFYAQPYNIMAEGFYFADAEEFLKQSAACRDEFGHQVEEFEIQFIDGDCLDGVLFNALGIHQGDICAFLERLETFDDEQKIKLILAVGEGGYSYDVISGEPEDFDIDIYHDMTLRDLAYIFVDEGLFGTIPQCLESYLDYDAIARDLAHDYVETRICGENYVYRLA